MKVFISWSGESSLRVAQTLRDWLPSVIQSLEPYVSSEDIDKGARWSTDISRELEEASYGILCVTRENMEAPWLNFEAGALSKSFEKGRVSPLLFGVKRSEIKGPILQFQSTVTERDDVKKLLKSLNWSCSPPLLDDGRLEMIFDVWWPRLAESLDALSGASSAAPTGEHKTSTETIAENSAILEEMLELVRAQHKILNSPESLLPPSYMANIYRFREDEFEHPVFMDLTESWELAAAELRKIAADHPEISEMVIKVMARMDGPISYVTRRTSRGRRLGRRGLGPPAV